MFYLFKSLFILTTILGECQHLSNIAQPVSRGAGGQTQACLTPKALTQTGTNFSTYFTNRSTVFPIPAFLPHPYAWACARFLTSSYIHQELGHTSEARKLTIPAKPLKIPLPRRLDPVSQPLTLGVKPEAGTIISQRCSPPSQSQRDWGMAGQFPWHLSALQDFLPFHHRPNPKILTKPQDFPDQSWASPEATAKSRDHQPRP